MVSRDLPDWMLFTLATKNGAESLQARPSNWHKSGTSPQLNPWPYKAQGRHHHSIPNGNALDPICTTG